MLEKNNVLQFTYEGWRVSGGTGFVWLASYPRSGNTFLRTILWRCFALRSASIYPNDLGGNKKLEEHVGHIEHDEDHRVGFPEGGIPLIKTHQHSTDSTPAIYVIRDGRAAAVSLWKFMNRVFPLRAVVEGQHQFGSWSYHVESWRPWDRKNTLLLRYEDMKQNPAAVLSSISEFLNRDVLQKTILDRDAIAKESGGWVQLESDWRADLRGDLLERFNALNKAVLMRAGYSN